MFNEIKACKRILQYNYLRVPLPTCDGYAEKASSRHLFFAWRVMDS